MSDRTQQPLVRCRWCGKPRRKFSAWEQQHLKTDEYSPLCSRCATKRLNNPLNALLPMRKIAIPDNGDKKEAGDEYVRV